MFGWLLLAAMTGATSAAPAPSNRRGASIDSDNVRIAALARSMCMAPAMYGLTISSSGKIYGKLNPGFLIKALGKADIGASVTGSAIWFRGIAQRDVGAALASYNQCTVAALRIFSRQMSFKNANTGRQIALPSNLKNVVAQLNRQPATNSVTNTINSSGPNAVNVQGNPTFNFATPTSQHLPNFLDLGAPCMPGEEYPNKVTPFSELTNGELRVQIADKLKSLLAIDATVKRQRDAAIKNATAGSPPSFDAVYAEAASAYQPIQRPLSDLYIELLERTHSRFALGPGDGLSLEGEYAFCGSFETKSGASDFASYIDTLSTKLPR